MYIHVLRYVKRLLSGPVKSAELVEQLGKLVSRAGSEGW